MTHKERLNNMTNAHYAYVMSKGLKSKCDMCICTGNLHTSCNGCCQMSIETWLESEGTNGLRGYFKIPEELWEKSPSQASVLWKLYIYNFVEKVPVTKEEFEDYNKKYAEWEESVEKALKCVHSQECETD